MNRSIISLTLVVGLAVSSAANAEETAAPKKQRIVRVSTLNSIKANQEFSRNVRIVRAQRQNIIDLQTQIEAEKDAKKKAALQARVDEAIKKLNENNQKMFKTYGFSLTRNYIMAVEKAHIYMLVSDEEAARIEKANAEKAAATQE